MEITAYNLHWRLLSPESWSSSNSSLLAAGWSRRCYPIKPETRPNRKAFFPFDKGLRIDIV